MSRTRAIPPIPDHVDPVKQEQRHALADFRIAASKPEVVKPPDDGKAN